MADNRLIPASIRDKNTETLNELADRLHALDMKALLIYCIDIVDPIYLEDLADQFGVLSPEWSLIQPDDIKGKRTLIKNAIELHRYRGTPYAIESIFSTLSLDGKLSEWFEYGGEPYMFRIDIHLPDGISKEKMLMLLALIRKYKNTRSHMETIHQRITILSETPCYSSLLQVGTQITIWPKDEPLPQPPEPRPLQYAHCQFDYSGNRQTENASGETEATEVFDYADNRQMENVSGETSAHYEIEGEQDGKS